MSFLKISFHVHNSFISSNNFFSKCKQTSDLFIFIKDIRNTGSNIASSKRLELLCTGTAQKMKLSMYFFSKWSKSVGNCGLTHVY